MDDSWWDNFLPMSPHIKPPGSKEMLRVIVYDISCPKRLRRIADICEQNGIRVQKSVFECWLDEARFEDLWQQLMTTIKPDHDSLGAYVIDTRFAKKRRAAGKKMMFSNRRNWFVY